METQTLTTRDVAALDWLTLRECANEIGVRPEVIRQACIRWRDGLPGGLPYAHFGAKPEDESERVNYRVHRDKWAEFKRQRAREDRAEERRITRLVAEPLDLIGRRRAGVAARGSSH